MANATFVENETQETAMTELKLEAMKSVKGAYAKASGSTINIYNSNTNTNTSTSTASTTSSSKGSSES